jgi:metallo-beta-lactamase class B
MRVIILIVLNCLLYCLSLAKDKPKLVITHLVDNFYIYTTAKTYDKDLIPANGMYIVTKSGTIMIDSPFDTTQFQPLLDSIKAKHSSEVVLCIATHSHEDRTAGLEYYKLKGIKTFTTSFTDSISKLREEKRSEFLIENDTTITIGEYSFSTYYPGPGHSPDNIVIWFEENKILYGGCFIKSTAVKDLGNLADANVKEWSTSITRTISKFENPNYIIPGHYNWTSLKSLNHTLNMVEKYKNKNGK